MKKFLETAPKVGVISVTDAPREQGLVQERENYINRAHAELISYLESCGMEIIDPSRKIEKDEPGWAAIYSYNDARECLKVLVSEDAEALVIGCWHWCEPMLIIALAREFNKPLLLYSDANPDWAGVTLISAAGASLWQSAPNTYSIVHKRVYGEKDEIVRWIRGVTSVEKLKRSTFIIWGGSYALKMDYLQDDFSRLKSHLVGEIINEDQYILIERSEKIPGRRIKSFIEWLINNNVTIKYDELMLTDEVFRKQIGLYLAAKDRINEYENVSGVSVKCFVELSDVYGADACLLPSFLPYYYDSEGTKNPIPCVCEGDIKALICSSLLGFINRGVPALFGDILFMGKDYLIMGNCGGSSVYYSCCSKNIKDLLNRLTIAQNFEGRGGAVSYDTMSGKQLTVMRLLRLKDEYIVLLGLMQTLEISPDLRCGTRFFRNWPLTAIKFTVDRNLLVDSLGANHLIAMTGDLTNEVTYACNTAGIKTFRIDNDSSIKEWLSYSASKGIYF